MTEVVEENVQYAEMSGPMGSLFVQLADTYDKIPQCILEIVQNAVDEDASRVDVDVVYTKADRYLEARDNGNGATPARLINALANIGKRNQKPKGKYGQFGYGFICLLGKGSSHSVIMTPKGKRKYHEFTFELDAILDQETKVGVPYVPRNNIGDVWWNTLFKCVDIIEDNNRTKVDLNRLENTICDKFRDGMLKNDTEVRISVTRGRKKEKRVFKAQKFSGKPLDEVSIVNGHSGENVFNLYIYSPVDRRTRGSVGISKKGNPSVVMSQEFLKNHKGYLSDGCRSCLSAGIFEGEIISDGLNLHPKRDKFVEEDALIDFCEALNEWYEKVGSVIHRRIKEEEANETYRKTADKALETVINSSSNALQESIKNLLKDTLDHNQIGDEDFPGVEPKKKKRKNNLIPGDLDPNRQKVERKKRNPVIDHERNRKSQYTKNEKTGIGIYHVEFIQGNELYYFDPIEADIYICYRHPFWEMKEREMERNKYALEEFQIEIIVEVLVSYNLPEDERINALVFFGEKMQMIFEVLFGRK